MQTLIASTVSIQGVEPLHIFAFFGALFLGIAAIVGIFVLKRWPKLIDQTYEITARKDDDEEPKP